MKVAFVFAALLIVGSNAFLADTFETVGNVLNNIKEAGKQLITTALAKGKEVLSGLASTGAQHIANLADKFGLLGAVGRRDAGKMLGGKMDGKMGGKMMGGKMMDSLKGMSKTLIAKLKQHLGSNGANVLQKFSDAIDALKAKVDAFHAKVNSAMDDDAAKVAADDMSKAVDDVVADHAAKQDSLKRSVFSDISDLLAPHVQTLKDTVANVGTTLKGHATNLLNSLKSNIADLGAKLSGHVGDLKTHGTTLLNHGKNALDALKGAVTDVLNQTLTNIKPSLDGLAKTGSAAAAVAAGHIADTLKDAAAGSA